MPLRIPHDKAHQRVTPVRFGPACDAEQEHALSHSEQCNVECRRLDNVPLTLFPTERERDPLAGVGRARACLDHPREPPDPHH
jgi:hypothetical protein